jgi:hypothetical protein
MSKSGFAEATASADAGELQVTVPLAPSLTLVDGLIIVPNLHR